MDKSWNGGLGDSEERLEYHKNYKEEDKANLKEMEDYVGRLEKLVAAMYTLSPEEFCDWGHLRGKNLIMKKIELGFKEYKI